MEDSVAEAPQEAFPSQDVYYSPYKFERSVLAHVVGTLLAWFIGLLVYLMYRLWQDYISTILTAFIVSQTLHSHRAQIVGLLQWLRSTAAPPLAHVLLGGLRHPLRLARRLLSGVPPLVQLSMLLAALLVRNVLTWAWISLALLGPALALLLATLVLDKKLLMTNALISDEVLAASVVIGTLITVFAFAVRRAPGTAWVSPRGAATPRAVPRSLIRGHSDRAVCARARRVARDSTVDDAVRAVGA